jgi:hypothetical protein
MKKMDPTVAKKHKLLLLQSLKELHKNAEELWKTVSKSGAKEVDFNYFISKYLRYVKRAKILYGKRANEFDVIIKDNEYKQLAGLKKIITEMGLLILFVENDVGNVIEENKKLKKLLKKYKSQAMSIQKIT